MASNPYTTNLELQLDARDIAGLSDGDPIVTWEDSSAAGNDVTNGGTSATRPAYKTNIIGSNPVARFAASNNRSLHGSLASSWSGFNGVTVFTLLQYNGDALTNYGGIVSLSTTAGSDYLNGLSMQCEATDSSRAWGRSVIGLYANNSPMTGPIGDLTRGVPVLVGFAIKQGSNGVKVVSPLGISSELSTIQISGTPEEVVIGNRYLGGSVNGSTGGCFDAAMILVYKEYMSDSNIGDVVDWMLTEFDLHTQAGGGSGGVLIRPGMTGGMIG